MRFQKHSILALALVNFFLFALTFLFLEIGMRLFFPELQPYVSQTRKFWEYDPMLGWKNIEGASGSQYVNGKEIKININSRGFRDDELSSSDNSEVKKILVLGDSFGWGFGVNAEDSFSEIIESELESVITINSSVAGYSTDQQLIYYLNEGYKYKADFVLLLFCENDFLGNTSDNIYWYNKPVYNLQMDSLILSNIPVPESTIYQKFRRFISGKSYFLSYILSRLSIVNVNSWSEDDIEISFSEKITSRLLNKLNEAVLKNNSKLLVVTIQINEKQRLFFEQLSADKGFYYFDLSLLFKYEKNYLIPDDGHWNEKGHRIAGEAVAGWIKQLNILQQ